MREPPEESPQSAKIVLYQAADDNICLGGELTPQATISKMEIVQSAGAKAYGEYEKYRVQQDREYNSDFDEEFARYLKGKEKP